MAVRRSPRRAALVLGSTQGAALVRAEAASRAGIDVARRRSGGGAVLVGPEDPIWIDLWIPRSDPLWSDDVGRAPAWVGESWAAALRANGAGDVSVHRGRPLPGPHSASICFGGLGPGEVLVAGRKVVGVAQWRCREGALFHSCAYRHWDPTQLVELLDLPGTARPGGTAAAVGALRQAATGVDAVGDGSLRGEALWEHLPAGDWGPLPPA